MGPRKGRRSGHGTPLEVPSTTGSSLDLINCDGIALRARFEVTHTRDSTSALGGWHEGGLVNARSAQSAGTGAKVRLGLEGSAP